jgi:hypothetical protein
MIAVDFAVADFGGSDANDLALAGIRSNLQR